MLLLLLIRGVQSDDVPEKKEKSVKKQLNDSHDSFQQTNSGSDQLPDSFEIFFYVIIAVSVLALVIILFKVYR